MKFFGAKYVISTVMILGFMIGSTNAVFANEESYEENYEENATMAAKPNSQPTLLPKNGTEGEYGTLASNSRTIGSGTGGTLTSNAWLGRLSTNGLVDYQASANYNKTDHQYIQTKWYATIESYTTTKSATVTLSTASASVSATTSSTKTKAQTASKYYQNTKSQKDASYRSNIAVQGDWSKVYLTNEASIWGNKVVKKAAINSQTFIKK